MEADKKQCKQCGQIKLRILAGRFPNLRNKKYEDEDGLLWNGHTCGRCHQEKMKLNMKSKRVRK